jgi:hypothetical protein
MISAPIREHNINRPLAVILTAHFSGKEICNYLPMENQSIPEEAGKTTASFGSDAHNGKSNGAKDCDRRKENFLTDAVGDSLCNERTGAGPEIRGDCRDWTLRNRPSRRLRPFEEPTTGLAISDDCCA